MTSDGTIDSQTLVDSFLEAVRLPLSREHDCPYLPDRLARSEALLVRALSPETYAAFMDRGFRRDSQVIHRPVCDQCSACRQLRVPAAEFSPSRSQKRVWRRNQDLRVTVAQPRLTDRKWQMFVDYLDFQHDEVMSRTRESMADFLYESPVDTIEICYWLGDELVAVSLADRAPSSLSSVYVYFDPKRERRSPGTFTALWEIDYCHRSGMAYYYLGYYVAGSKTMDYKIRFRPCEILDRSRRWARPPAEPRTAVPAD